MNVVATGDEVVCLNVVTTGAVVVGTEVGAPVVVGTAVVELERVVKAGAGCLSPLWSLNVL